MELSYDFYTSIYYGELISEPLFEKYQKKATSKVLFLLGRPKFTEDDYDVYEDKINMAICSVADIIYQIDLAKKNSGTSNSSNIKSMMSGGESITFGDNVSEIESVLSDTKKQNRLCYQTMYEYLYDTGLMYRGI